MKVDAIGVVEVNFYSNAVVVLDEMLKASKVDLISCHKRLGGRMVHSVVSGKTSSVEAAIEAAKASGRKVGHENVKVAITISNPHPEVIKLMNLLEDKLRIKEQA
ncbi:MAG: ethanolamine utilization protein EutM [Clostridiales bacterium]|nr:ethanolamine utilization protein EutM [Clostridiales bacterium]